MFTLHNRTSITPGAQVNVESLAIAKIIEAMGDLHPTAANINADAHVIDTGMLNIAEASLFNPTESLGQLNSELTVYLINGPQSHYEAQPVAIPSFGDDALAVNLIGQPFHLVFG